MSETPRYATLRDYLRVIRAQRVLIALMTLVFAVAGLGISLIQHKTYTASAQVNFRDVNADLAVVGRGSTPETTPDQRAAENADLVTRPEVNQEVKRLLNSPQSPDQLASDISAQVAATTNFVVIQASDSSPKFAAGLANAYARTVTRLGNREEHRRLQNAINSERKQTGRGPAVTFEQQQAQALLNQLRAAQAIVDPVQLVEKAQVPSGPSSPKPALNTILGALVGLVLALAAAFLRDSLDRRLHSASQAADAVGAPILGKISEDALGYAGFSHNGANKKRLDEADFEAFRMLRTNLEFFNADGGLKSVLVTSGLADEGKSTVAASLAAASALAGKRTLLVECDLRRPSLAGRLNISRSPGLTEFLTDRASPQEILQPVPVEALTGNGSGAAKRKEDPLLVCITAGAPVAHPAELLGSSKVGEFLEQVTGVYDSVIIDTCPLLSVVDALELVPRVDGVLVCVRVAQTTSQELRATRAALERLPERPIGVVVTGIRKGDQEDYGYYGYAERRKAPA